jgi:hypothetical protein
MQTVVWMTYSDSTHFSDKLSYKIHFIPSYHLKDMNFGSFKLLQEFQKNREELRIFLTHTELAAKAERGTGLLMRLLTGILTSR